MQSMSQKGEEKIKKNESPRNSTFKRKKNERSIESNDDEISLWRKIVFRLFSHKKSTTLTFYVQTFTYMYQWIFIYEKIQCVCYEEVTVISYFLQDERTVHAK